VAVRTLADDLGGDEVGEHAELPPLLALLHVGEVHLDDRPGDELQGVVDRPAVMRPGARIHDHAVRPFRRVVDPLDEFALAVRLSAADAELELVRPFVDPRLELGERHAGVMLWVALAELVQVDAVEDDRAHRRTLTGDQRIERGANLRLRQLGAGQRAADVFEQDEPDAAVPHLLVAAHRLPRALPVAAQRRTSSSSPSCHSGSPTSRPVFTTSAIPSRRSEAGSVASSAGSITTRAGQWNAPTRFLPAETLIAVLPPIAASTWPTRLVG